MRAHRLTAVVALAFAAAASLSGCSTTRKGPPAALAIGADSDDLDLESLALAADRSAEALAKLPPKKLEAGGRSWLPAELAASAKRVAVLARHAGSERELTRQLARECLAWQSGTAAKITGYYEPVLAARRQASQRFRYPLYGMPSPEQLAGVQARLGHAPTRADIDGANALDGLGIEIAWVDDPVARFFLQIQGSGRLAFDDGTEVRVGYAGNNGLPYRSIGMVMVERGLLERSRVTAPAIREWLFAHPSESDAMMAENPRYVFFRETGREGPFGSLGTALVAGRSIAVDRQFVPPGILAWLETARPVGDDADGARITRFVFAQDSGAAIKGPGRVDLFLGAGDEAAFEAGRMNEAGQLWLLYCREPQAGK